MPLFLLRDGSIRRLPLRPEGVATLPWVDRFRRRMEIVLDAGSERRLLALQPPRGRGLRSRGLPGRRHGGAEAA